MKKFIFGVLVGGLIMSAIPAYGAVTSLIGENVDGQSTVTFNGKEVGTAIIVESKSYIPVRDIAEAIGLNVEPKAGRIDLSNLSSADAAEHVRIELETIRKDKTSIESQITKIQQTIKYQEETALPKAIERAGIIASQSVRTDAEKAYAQKQVDELRQSIADNKQKLADLQAKLDTINARITELEAQQ
jgi:hypothetical protein